MQAALDAVYTERNAALQALASILRHDDRYVVGVRNPIEDAAWPLLVIARKEGPVRTQIAWHVPASELSPEFTKVTVPYDGHSNTEKYRRLDELRAQYTAIK